MGEGTAIPIHCLAPCTPIPPSCNSTTRHIHVMTMRPSHPAPGDRKHGELRGPPTTPPPDARSSPVLVCQSGHSAAFQQFRDRWPSERSRRRGRGASEAAPCHGRYSGATPATSVPAEPGKWQYELSPCGRGGNPASHSARDSHGPASAGEAAFCVTGPHGRPGRRSRRRRAGAGAGGSTEPEAIHAGSAERAGRLSEPSGSISVHAHQRGPPGCRLQAPPVPFPAWELMAVLGPSSSLHRAYDASGKGLNTSGLGCSS